MAKQFTDKVNPIEKFTRFEIILRKYENLALNVFKWENLPPSIDSRHIEKALYTHGQAVFFDSKDYGLICLPCSNADRINVYGEPTKVIATGYNFTEVVDIKTNGVRIMNNANMLPTAVVIRQYAMDMLEVERSIKANIKQQKFPYAFFCDEKTRLSMKNIYQKLEDGEPVIYVNKSLTMEDLQFFNTQAPYVVDKLRQERYELEREILTFLGLNNNFEKAERLLVDEVNSNNDFISRNVEVMFDERKKACEEINKRFGLNIEVVKKNDIQKEENIQDQLRMQEVGGDDDGKLHN